MQQQLNAATDEIELYKNGTSRLEEEILDKESTLWQLQGHKPARLTKWHEYHASEDRVRMHQNLRSVSKTSTKQASEHGRPPLINDT